MNLIFAYKLQLFKLYLLSKGYLLLCYNDILFSFQMYKDGSETLIESLSLIDAVMPDVVLSRQQQAHNNKNAAVKTEAANANGEEGGGKF